MKQSNQTQGREEVRLARELTHVDGGKANTKWVNPTLREKLLEGRYAIPVRFIGDQPENIEWTQVSLRDRLGGKRPRPTNICYNMFSPYLPNSRRELEAMGIEILDEEEGGMLYDAILPEGWTLMQNPQTDDKEHTVLVDSGGNVRAKQFYKHTAHDTNANITIVGANQ